MKRIVTFLLIISAFCVVFSQTEFGTASYYGLQFHGKPTASGQIYSQNKLTAAHKTLPLGTLVKVTNTKNNRSVYVKINDRGPYIKGRIIDLSTKAAEILGYRNRGTAYVKIEVIKANDIPADLLAASMDLARMNGIKNYDSLSPATGITTWKDVPTVLDDQPEPKEEVITPIEKNNAANVSSKEDIQPIKELPQPAAEIRLFNDSSIINRSPYFVITNIDKSKAGFYAVQVGVFSDPSVIFALMEELEKFKQSLMIQQVKENGKTVYKLFMGNFQNRAYADALKSVISDKYKDALVFKYE